MNENLNKISILNKKNIENRYFSDWVVKRKNIFILYHRKYILDTCVGKSQKPDLSNNI